MRRKISETIACAVMLSAVLCGCAETLNAIDDPEFASIADKLAKCRAEARAYVQTSPDPQSKETARDAYQVYQACKHREGLQ